MSEAKKRMTIRIGTVISNQTFDEAGAMLDDNIVSTWGGSIHHLEFDESVLIQTRLNEELADDLLAIQKKAQTVMAEFGKEMVSTGGSGRFIGDGKK